MTIREALRHYVALSECKRARGEHQFSDASRPFTSAWRRQASRRASRSKTSCVRVRSNYRESSTRRWTRLSRSTMNSASSCSIRPQNTCSGAAPRRRSGHRSNGSFLRISATVHRTHFFEFRDAAATSRLTGFLSPAWAMRADGQEFPIEASISKSGVEGNRLFTAFLRDITAAVRRRTWSLRNSEETIPPARPCTTWPRASIPSTRMDWLPT